jgi:hypothetical protein
VRADLPEPGERRPRFARFRKKPKAKGGGRPDRDTVPAIEQFVASRLGVEAYVEPQTTTQPLSVVLVAADGEWIRKRIPDAGWLQKLAKVRVPVYDASLVGYPKRMRDYRRPGSADT